MQKHKTSSRVPKGSDGAWGEDQRTSMGQKKEDAEEEVEAEERGAAHAPRAARVRRLAPREPLRQQVWCWFGVVRVQCC